MPNVLESLMSFAEEIFCLAIGAAIQAALYRFNKNSGYRKFRETKRC